MKTSISIITPVYNDWKCFNLLCKDIYENLKDDFSKINIIAINDCSTELPPVLSNFKNIYIDRIDLTTNVGHQRAILIGLCHLHNIGNKCENIIVMDSDGEDKPEDIIKLYKKNCLNDKKKIIFAKRSKRSEGFTFKVFYKVYKLLFILLTGKKISFGNFSYIPKALLPRIVNDQNFWNHYSSAILKSKIPYSFVNTTRGNRYFGNSKMNFTSLVIHAFSSLSIYIETIIIRILKCSFLSFFVLFLGLLAIIYVKYFTNQAIPGWSSFLFAVLVNILITVTLFVLVIILLQLNSRKDPINRPISFYKDLIEFVYKSDENINQTS